MQECPFLVQRLKPFYEKIMVNKVVDYLYNQSCWLFVEKRD